LPARLDAARTDASAPSCGPIEPVWPSGAVRRLGSVSDHRAKPRQVGHPGGLERDYCVDRLRAQGRALALPQSSGNELTYLQIVASTAKANVARYAKSRPTRANQQDFRLWPRHLPIPGMFTHSPRGGLRG